MNEQGGGFPPLASCGGLLWARNLQLHSDPQNTWIRDHVAIRLVDFVRSGGGTEITLGQQGQRVAVDNLVRWQTSVCFRRHCSHGCSPARQRHLIAARKVLREFGRRRRLLAGGHNRRRGALGACTTGGRRNGARPIMGGWGAISGFAACFAAASKSFCTGGVNAASPAARRKQSASPMPTSITVAAAIRRIRWSISFFLWDARRTKSI